MNTLRLSVQDAKVVIEEIYVYLLDEGTDVWRPTKGQRVGDFIYRLLSTENYDPEIEEWEFPPGSIVRCEYQDLSGGHHLVAKEIVNPQQ
jgi:hypothetical protein